MNDLRYLADYDPECFEKTCKNVVYNIPQAKPVILQKEEPKESTVPPQKIENRDMEMRYTIDQIVDNLKHIEAEKIPVGEIDVERVKKILGV